MRSTLMRHACHLGIPCVISRVALVYGLTLIVSTAIALGADLQSSTDSAAIEAKRNLCIALNRGTAASELKENFLAFYEGKVVSAKRLQPETFRIGQIGPLPAFNVVQVLGPNEMLVSITGKLFKMREVSTADMADDQSVRMTDFFTVRGTETYNTVAGSTNTVYVLELARGKMPAVMPTRVYPWYNRNDEVVITGELKAIEGPKAVFLVDGQESSVPLTKFTRGDREVMRLLMDRYPQEKPQEKPKETSVEKPPLRPVGRE